LIVPDLRQRVPDDAIDVLQSQLGAVRQRRHFECGGQGRESGLAARGKLR
jgi:hypothetical protein